MSSVALPAEAIPGLGALRPGWLRPLALGVILALHALMFVTIRGRPASLSPELIDISLVQMGDSDVDQQKVEEIRPAEPAPPAPPPPAAQELAAPPPVVPAPEAAPLPVATPKPAVKPKREIREKDNRPTREELLEQKRAREAAERRKEEQAEERRKAQQGRAALRRGAAGGAASAGMSRASYTGILAAEVARHKFYPAAARAVGATGSVGVAFTIGPSGRVVRRSITSSSGNASLDAAANAILSAIHAPPPPGGSFSTSTRLNFHMN